jgi:hypothetical protein
VHDDLGVRKGGRNVGGRVAVIGVLVSDQDVAQRERPFGNRPEDRRGQAGGVDQRGRPSVVEEEQVAVGGVRIVGVMAHVAGQLHVRFPPPQGRIGELPGVEAQKLGQRTRLGLVRSAPTLLPLGDVVGGETAARRQGGGVEARSARRFAQDVAEIVFEHGRSLCSPGSRLRL